MDENQEGKFNSEALSQSTSGPLKQIRTFQGDVSEALARQKESIVSIQQAEVKRRTALGQEVSEISDRRVPTKTFFLLLGIIVLLALGALGIWYSYLSYMRIATPPVVLAPENRFFSTDTEAEVTPSSSRLDLIAAITSAQTEVEESETRHLKINLDAQTFFKTLDTEAPGSLTRALDKPFMLGAYGESTFLIFKLVSFENAFAGMLNWEKNLAQDIGPIFSTRELLRDIELEPVFIDVTDRNKDVRALEAVGESLLMYSFFDNDILIITDNIETLRVLVERLNREKLSR